LSAKEKVLVSACLIGENVKYNGKNNKIVFPQEFLKSFELVPFCPEVEGGLPTPRPPSEIISKNPLKIINNQNKDVTKEFIEGAKKTLEICKKLSIKKAILKENSPSCGKNFVYDGSFQKRLKSGQGVTASILIKNNLKVFNEYEIDKILY